MSDSESGSSEMAPYGWRGFGASAVSVNCEKRHRLDGKCWLAISTDPTDGQIAISVWEGEGPARRHVSMWMPREAAERLQKAIAEELTRPAATLATDGASVNRPSHGEER